MKKFIFALCLLIGCVVAAGQWNVYDYKASVKCLNSKITKTSYSANAFDKKSDMNDVFDSFVTTTTTLTGYLLIPSCSSCSEDGVTTSLSFDESYLYLIRKEDSAKAVWKFFPEVRAAMFGPQVGVRPIDDDLAGMPTSMKKLTQVWMEISFPFDNMSLTASQAGYDELPYGFLGFGCGEGVVVSTGFGKVKTIVTTSQDSFCAEPSNSICSSITSMADGRMVGGVIQTNCCGVAAVWDICSMDQTEDGVLSGAWSIKYNSKMSKSVNESEDIDDFILGKLKGSSIVNLE